MSTGSARCGSPTNARPTPCSIARSTNTFAFCRSTKPAIDHDPIPRTQHVRRRPAICDTRAGVDLPHAQSCPHLRTGHIGTPPVAVVGEQCMNTGCRSPNLAGRHRRRFPGRSDDEHTPPLSTQRCQRNTQHRRLACASGAGDRDEPVGPGDRARGDALRGIQCRDVLVRCKAMQLVRQERAPWPGEQVQASGEAHLRAHCLGRDEGLHVRRWDLRNEPIDGLRGARRDHDDHVVELVALRNDARPRECTNCARADV